MELKFGQSIQQSMNNAPLIVPYGIEMTILFILFIVQIPLIVPYGIEMKFLLLHLELPETFNRTIWN